MKSICAKLLETIKKKWWYLLLLFASSIYVWTNRHRIDQLSELNASNLIFLVWILLLLMPLFSEMEFLGIKIKKEVEKANKEVKDSLQHLQNQVTGIQWSNTISNNISLNSAPLPSEAQIKELSQLLQNLQSAHSSANNEFVYSAPSTDDKTMFLTQTRSEIEKSLRILCEKIGAQDKLPLTKMLQVLSSMEVISGATRDLASQVIRIANRGVHGEIISNEYISFVKDSYPEIMRQLKNASNQLVFMNCPHCGYSGYSRYENACPRCGYITDD